VRTLPRLPSVRRGLRAETERHRADAPPLVMPAFEPGWVADFCRCRRPRRRARRPPSSPFPFCVRIQRCPSPPRRVERRDAFATRTCPRARACACHGARTRAPQYARVATVRARPGLGPFSSSPAAATEPPCSPRRRPARNDRVTVAQGSTPCRWVPRAPCRAPGRERASPTTGTSLAATHGDEPGSVVAPPRRPVANPSPYPG
jgi:hypothetical protein